MTARDFCNWFQGVLEMSEQEEDGEVIFSKIQVDKIKTRLEMALKDESDIPPHMRPGSAGTARC